MSIIVFDMEWNMGYPRPDEPHFDEIIEIGAAKVENNEIVGTYKEYIRPTIHNAIHHHVRKMLPFTKKDLKDAKNFRTVVKEFEDWCGEKPLLVSWGNSDISVLQSNLERYNLPTDWIGSVYDLQAGYAYLLGEYTHQYALKDVVEQFQIEAPEEFHDAANDAYYTALIGIAIIQKYGELPSTEVIQAKREELRAIHAEEVRIKALEIESTAVTETEPLAPPVTFGSYDTGDQVLKNCSVWVCPECGRRINGVGWSYYAEKGWLTRGHCGEHGWQYAFTTLEQKEDGWQGTRILLPATQKLKNSWFRFGHNKDAKTRR